MSIHHDEPFDPCKPALIVIVGNTARKHRALDRDVVVLGRAHGCDLGLSAPDVSSIHCLIYRSPDGLRIRDCQSRSGTHVNGLAIQDRELRDGDTIQVGPFSFQAHLPPGTAGPLGGLPSRGASTSEYARHVERARRRLAQLALNLRRRLLEVRSSQEEPETFVKRQAELDQQADFLRGKAREYEQRAQKLQEAERTLASDRAALEREAAAREQRQQQDKLNLAEQRATLERLHEENRMERDRQRHEVNECDRSPSLPPLLEEPAEHCQLTELDLPGTSSLSDTPIPTDWREWLEPFGTVRMEPRPDAVPLS